jgi:hypothetical protein
MEDVGIFSGHLDYFTAIWSIYCHLVYLLPFGIFYCHLVYFVANWYIFPRLGKFSTFWVCWTHKNLATLVIAAENQMNRKEDFFSIEESE